MSPACIAWEKEPQQDFGSAHNIGDLAVQRIYNQSVNPGVVIDGHLIPLPLIPLLDDRIRAVATRASSSRNGVDLVDYSAGLIWELNYDQLRIISPSWPAFLESIKQDVAHGLGLAPSDIDVKPDKLLLYEKGFLFRRHKDSGKPQK